jgi:hypothetical protein
LTVPDRTISSRIAAEAHPASRSQPDLGEQEPFAMPRFIAIALGIAATAAATLIGIAFFEGRDQLARLDGRLGDIDGRIASLTILVRERSDAIAGRLDEARDPRVGAPGADTGLRGEPSESAGGIEESIAALRRQVESLRELIDAAKQSGVIQFARVPRDVEFTSSFADSGAFVATGDSAVAAGNNPDAPRWGAGQMLGEPDTLEPGDNVTAWASRTGDEGEVTVDVGFGESLRASGIVIRETFNPGAIARVEILGTDGKYALVWEGDSVTSEALREFEIEFSRRETSGARITLDTNRVSGWNEIDAVGLISGGRVFWATEANASSNYGS